LSPGQRRLAAVMFTDLVGYTALGQKREDLSLALVEEQRKLVRPILQRHNGREVKTMGDAFLVEFPNALDAVRCAYDIQRAAREFNISLAPDRRLHLRVGIHLGDVVESQGDISGDAVNIASRIEPLAEDGGVCLTRQVYDQISNKFEVRVESLGPKRLRNVSVPMEVFKMVMPWEKLAGPSADKRRIAVLPFVNMSPDPNDAYFADGITEEIISTVSGISGLGVISRTSVMGYRNTTKKLREIGKELEVGSVLEGSLRKAGNRIRISAQLIEVETDQHLWTQSYDRELSDVFAVQSDVAKQVADALRVRILPDEKVRLNKTPTANPESHSLYLKGRYYWDVRSEQSLTKAVEYYEKAVKLDPNYALAYSGIADCYIVMGDHMYIPFHEAFLNARENASKAVELDETSAEAHTSLAYAILYNDRDAITAARQFEEAIHLSPSYATAHQWYGVCLLRTGRSAEALEKALRAQELDPLSPQIASFVGLCYLYLGKYDLAERQQFRALELHPNFIPGITNLRFTYLIENKYAEAEKEAMEYLKITGDRLLCKLWLAAIYARSGRESEARNAMAEAKAMPNPHNLHCNQRIIFHVALREFESAIKLIEEEYDAHANWLGEIAIDPLYAPIRTDPRVQSILEKVGLPA
jgi:adenylate cyclase